MILFPLRSRLSNTVQAICLTQDQVIGQLGSFSVWEQSETASGFHSCFSSLPVEMWLFIASQTRQKNEAFLKKLEKIAEHLKFLISACSTNHVPAWRWDTRDGRRHECRRERASRDLTHVAAWIIEPTVAPPLQTFKFTWRFVRLSNFGSGWSG